MRTISKKTLLRLEAQANEADICGANHIADQITHQIEKYATADAVRDTEDNYEYSKEEMVEDIKKSLWEAATRIFDYYDETPDAREIQDLIDFEADHFVSYFDNLVHKNIGPYEKEVPGQEEDEEIEASDEDDGAFNGKLTDSLVDYTADDEDDESAYVVDEDEEDEEDDEDLDEEDPWIGNAKDFAKSLGISAAQAKQIASKCSKMREDGDTRDWTTILEEATRETK